MKYLIILAMLFLAGCEMKPKEIGKRIDECSQAGLGFTILYNGFNYAVRDVQCCNQSTVLTSCDKSRLKEIK